jgi:pimeloyl-ACP methyl ester carboxylesterase
MADTRRGEAGNDSGLAMPGTGSGSAGATATAGWNRVNRRQTPWCRLFARPTGATYITGAVMKKHLQNHRIAVTTTPPIGRLYNVGGRRLFLHRSGSRGPVVVFLAGASAVGLDYLNVHDQVAEFTTSVLYDRGGTGWSDPVELPRTAADVASELRELLCAAGVPGPYLLVAHSLGGAYARRFAQLFPDEVAGMLWLDAFHEDWDAYMPESLHLARIRQPRPGRLQAWLICRLSRPLYSRMFASWPVQVREPLIKGHVAPEWLHVGVQERSNMPQLATELRQGGARLDVPLIALTALKVDRGQAMLMSKAAMRDLMDGKRRLDAALATSVSQGQHRAFDDAGHSSIAIDRPDAVVQAVRDLIDMIGE